MSLRKNGFDALRRQVIAVAEEQIRKEITRMSSIARRAANIEVSKLFDIISIGDRETRAMSGSNFTPPYLRSFIPRWAPLSKKTVVQKRHDRFFDFKGRLRNEIRDYDPVSMFGSTRVSNLASPEGNGRRTITIQPFPAVQQMLERQQFLALDKQYFGRLDPHIFIKLANRGKRQKFRKYRPLVGPTMLYLAAYRIPRAVIRALRQAGYEVKSGLS